MPETRRPHRATQRASAAPSARGRSLRDVVRRCLSCIRHCASPSAPQRPFLPRRFYHHAYRYWREWAIDCLPGECLICGDRARRALCDHCEDVYWSIEAAVRRCFRCGIRISSASALCGRCQVARPAFDRTVALADYRPPLDIVAITLKFRGRPALAIDLAKRLSEKLIALRSEAARDTDAPAVGSGATEASDVSDAFDLPDLLVPVPLSARRLAERGYNQAWELTRRLAAHTGIPADAALLRRAHTAAQSGLDLTSRRRNMREAISIARSDRRSPDHASMSVVRGRHIGVVDDVMTTGATFDAVARTLKAAGARRVTNLVAFRTA